MISSYDMVKGLVEKMTLGGVHNRAQARRAPRQPSLALGKKSTEFWGRMWRRHHRRVY